MRTLFQALCATSLFFFSGCMTTSTSTETEQGKRVIATFMGGANKQFSLKFDDGVICQGEYQGTATGGDKTVPVSCSDGTTGTAIVKATTNVGNVGILSFRLQNGTSGTVRLEAGKKLSLPASGNRMLSSPEETKDSEEELNKVYLDTCKSSNVSGKAALAFRMRLNGLSRTQTRVQLGDAKQGTVGYVIREAALDAAFSGETTSTRSASLMGMVYCAERFKQAH